jgi:hypothetical protein
MATTPRMIRIIARKRLTGSPYSSMAHTTGSYSWRKQRRPYRRRWAPWASDEGPRVDEPAVGAQSRTHTPSRQPQSVACLRYWPFRGPAPCFLRPDRSSVAAGSLWRVWRSPRNQRLSPRGSALRLVPTSAAPDVGDDTDLAWSVHEPTVMSVGEVHGAQNNVLEPAPINERCVATAALEAAAARCRLRDGGAT